MIVYQEIFCKLFVAFESFKTLPKKHILMKINDNSTKQQIDYFEVITEKRYKNCPKMNKLDMKQIQSHSFIKFKSKKMF